MKNKFFALTLAILLILGLSFSGVQAGSVNYLGKTTWTFSITDSTNSSDIGNTGSITGGISRVGDEFYLFQGDLINNPYIILSGSGAMIGNNLMLTLSTSQWQPSHRDTGVMHIIIDKSTLNGTFFHIANEFDMNSRILSRSFLAGTLTRSGSIIPLSATIVPQLLLLQ
jgi:hypothetical protein